MQETQVVKDVLYGNMVLPKFVVILSETELMQRLRWLSQDVLPNVLLDYGSMATRFEHSLGVAYLMSLVIGSNPALNSVAPSLITAALFHDAGNPGFSHLFENFLEASTGVRAEGYLQQVVNTRLKELWKQYGVDPEIVFNLVAGTAQPLSGIISGSIDVDNIDNVLRYNHHAMCGGPLYNAKTIAQDFFWNKGEWTLPVEQYPEVVKWQECRRAVYAKIYEPAHLIPSQMLYRAAEFAHVDGDLTPSFYRFTDAQAFVFLRDECGPRTQVLINRVYGYTWYAKMFSLNTVRPNGKLQTLTKAFEPRMNAANTLAKKLLLPLEDVCIYAGFGRDSRTITIPFVDGGVKWYDPKPDQKNFRLQVFVNPEAKVTTRQITEILATEGYLD